MMRTLELRVRMTFDDRYVVDQAAHDVETAEEVKAAICHELGYLLYSDVDIEVVSEADQA